jgi:hypothetical protein
MPLFDRHKLECCVAAFPYLTCAFHWLWREVHHQCTCRYATQFVRSQRAPQIVSQCRRLSVKQNAKLPTARYASTALHAHDRSRNLGGHAFDVQVRCPVEHCEAGNCPQCTTVCKEPRCHTVCEPAAVSMHCLRTCKLQMHLSHEFAGAIVHQHLLCPYMCLAMSPSGYLPAPQMQIDLRGQRSMPRCRSRASTSS